MEIRCVFGLLANTINFDLGMIPGLNLIGPGLGFPVSVLAAFLERPFYSRAGVYRKTIWYSLQANLISHLFGILLTFAFFCLADALRGDEFPLFAWPFFAVACSIGIEGWYLRRQFPDRPLRWGWMAGGNVFSATFSVSLLFAILWARSAFPEYGLALKPAHIPLQLGSLVASVILMIASFFLTKQPRDADVSIPSKAADGRN